MKKFAINLTIIFYALSLNASNTISLDSANSAYKKGDFINAAKGYEKILSEGFESADLYYNLGNTYFRLKEIPKAILNFERARLLNPEDEDINYNLNLVNSFIVDKVTPLPEFIVLTWVKSIINNFTVNQWSIFSLGLFVTSLLLFLLFLFSGISFRRKLFFWAGTLLLFTSIISTVFALNSRSEIVNNHTAIITKAVTTAKSSPDDESTNLFIIHEGTKVIINEELDDWSEIKLLDGSIGWIKTNDFEKI